MSDFDQFERRLAAALRADADQNVARFEPASIARAAIASTRPRPLRGRLRSIPALGRPMMGVSYFLIVLGLVLALVVGAIAVGAFRTRQTGPAGWTATSALAEARTWATATLLPDGTVLVVGGDNGNAPVASAELFDAATGTWVATGSMAAARSDHTATLLRDGRVLVAGGRDGAQAQSATAELYDPITRSWTPTGNMAQGRANHTATLLPDGQVLVAGGFGVTSAELYDPATGTWASTGAMIRDRAYHTATLLPDGRVLAVGGFSGGGNPRATASAELYDPSSGSWTLAGDLHEPRTGHTATMLPDGHVLVVGGTRDSIVHATASAEQYDPGAGSWTLTGSMSTVRVYAAATLLPDGRVLVASGFNATFNNENPIRGPVAPAELFDPTSGSWTATGRMTAARSYPTATLLQDGRVLVTGGRTKPLLGSAMASAELYDPGSGTR